MIEVDKLYKLKRGNQNQTVSLIVKGVGASVVVYGSQSPPSSLSDMELCHDTEQVPTLGNGTWPFHTLPEYIYITGTADSIEIIDMSYTDLNITF